MMDPRQVEAAQRFLFWCLPIVASIFVLRLFKLVWRAFYE